MRNVLTALIVLTALGAVTFTIMVGITSGQLSDSQSQYDQEATTYDDLSQQKTDQDAEI